MKKKGKTTPLKVHNSSIAESKEIEMFEMPHEEYKNLFIKD
jgi:hypothetical protein